MRLRRRPTRSSLILAIGGILLFASPFYQSSAQQSARDVSREQARSSRDWVRDGVIYEIYPRAFSAQGNFNGITARLDDLKDLGVNILWLMPIHPIGQEKKKGTIGMVQDIHDDDWLLGPALAPLLTAMVRNGLVFDALVLPRHLPRLLRVIDSHPDLEFVLDHCGKPRLATGEIAIWQRDIALLAQHPNIVCKLSGLVTEAVPDWQIADLRQAVDHVRGCFGPQRLLWGSDWPVVNLAGGYAKWLAGAETLLVDLSPDERADIFGGNAARIYLSSRGRRCPDCTDATP